MILRKQFRFEASHRLPFHKGKCSRLHGHSWILDVTVKGPVDPKSGMVIDFYEITKAVQPIVDDLDHRHLGTCEMPTAIQSWDIAPWKVPWLPLDFNATSENLLLEIAKRLGDFNWSSLTLHETCTSAATLTRSEYVKASHSRNIP